MKITNGALAALLANLLTNPNSGEIDSMEGFEQFCTDLAEVVCNHCGGEVRMPAASQVSKIGDADDFRSAYALDIGPTESSPEDGGIWNRSPAVQVMQGYFGYEGTILHADFHVPVGATVAEKDSAFMAALAQQADIDYHAVCESNTPLPEGDFGLTAEQLEAKHGQEHPEYTRADWSNDVSQGDTKLGYWDWVLHNVESHYRAPCDECGNSGCDKVYLEGVGYLCKDCAETPDDDDVAEWVGLHYKVNFDAEPFHRKAEWRQRYIESLRG
jgi:hypothetical protein